MRVLVVGAGAAGITAGHLLLERGVDVEIVEADSVHGGRVRGIADFVDFPIDSGAEWIHKWITAKPPLLGSLLDGADPTRPTVKYRPRTFAVAHGGRVRHRNLLRFLTYVDDHKFVDSSWCEVIDDLVTPSLRERIRYSSPVERIEYDDAGVTLTLTSAESLRADAAIVTVPIRMLQLGAIDFEPPLPEPKLREIEREMMPGGLKLFIEFAERFYPDMTIVGKLLARRRGDCVYYDVALGKDTKRHVLGLFTQGESAERYLAAGDDEAIAAYALSELDGWFDGLASRHRIKHVVQNWSAEPYIGGSYSQRVASAKELAAPIADRVYFAGEAMNPNGKTIAVHGACESAYSAYSAYSAVEALLGER